MSEFETRWEPAQILQSLDNDNDRWLGLEQACVRISGLVAPQAADINVTFCLDWLASRVQAKMKGGHPDAALAYLHEVLFDEENFRGNLESYYVIENQLISSVLARRQGLPVMLSLIYKRVADRLQLSVDGLNMPGHFLLRVRDSFGWLVIDPFSGGRAMTINEALSRLADATDSTQAELAAKIEPTSPEAWFRRCAMSLASGLCRSGEFEKEEQVRDILKFLPD